METLSEQPQEEGRNFSHFISSWDQNEVTWIGMWYASELLGSHHHPCFSTFEYEGLYVSHIHYRAEIGMERLKSRAMHVVNLTRLMVELNQPRLNRIGYKPPILDRCQMKSQRYSGQWYDFGNSPRFSCGNIGGFWFITFSHSELFQG